MTDFLKTPGSLYGVDASEVDTNVRFKISGEIHTINPTGMNVNYDFESQTIKLTIREAKLVACKFQFFSLINKYGGFCDISFTTSREFVTPELLLMELRDCRIIDVQIDLVGQMGIVYELSVGSIFDVGDPAPWDSAEIAPSGMDIDDSQLPEADTEMAMSL